MTLRFVDHLSQDLRYALSGMRNNAVFAATAVLTFALGIGSITAIFTVIHAVLLRPLPYTEPGRVVEVATGTIARFEGIKAAAKSYTEPGTFIAQPGSITLSGEGDAQVVRVAVVSANFLRVLGVQPFVGRAFLDEEETGETPVAMISAGLWRRNFGGDPQIAGKQARLSGAQTTIIGVLPDGFHFPFGGVDVWATNPKRGMSPTTPGLTIFGRVKPNVSIAQASAELTVLTRQYSLAFPDMLDAVKSDKALEVRVFMERFVGSVRSMLWMLFGAVGLVLLIACSNVSGLLLARAQSRSAEFAVRAAIGAGRARIIRQLLVESLLLAGIGGAVGTLLGYWSLNAITQMTAFDLPRSSEIQLNGAVFSFAAAVTAVTGLLFGLIPSMTVSRHDLSSALKSGSTRISNRSPRIRTMLVAVQVAISIVLLAGATLLMQSMYRLYRVDPQFNSENVLTAQIALSPFRYNTDEKRIGFADELIRRVESVPGVRSVGLAWTLPFMSWPGTPVHWTDLPDVPLNKRPIAVINNISSGYFQTLQIPLVRGRLFAESDRAGAVPVVVVNEALVRHFWPEYPVGVNPVGRRLLVGANPKPAEIVGIVRDIKLYPDSPVRPSVYRPYRQAPLATALLVRSDSPASIAAGVREQLRALDADQAFIATKTMDELLEEALGQRRLVLVLLQMFAGIAVVLSIVGTYGIINYAVAGRTREVGVRIALGARGPHIVRCLTGQGVSATAIGIVLGLGGAYGLTRFLRSYLFEVSPTEPTTFAAVALGFLAVAALSTSFPLRRALRIDPVIALRDE